MTKDNHSGDGRSNGGGLPSLRPATGSAGDPEGYETYDQWKHFIRHEARRRESLGSDGYEHAQHIKWLQSLERKTGHHSTMMHHAMAMLYSAQNVEDTREAGQTQKTKE